jgi:maleate isomerase
MEPDFYFGVPAGWTVHTARMYMEETTVEGESRMLDEFTMPAARDVATAHPHVIVFGCTSAGALRGNAYDAELTQEIARQTGIPTVSVIKSVRDALQKLSATRLVVVTPYIDALNDQIRTSLEDDGLSVLRINGLGISENFQIAQVPRQEIVAFAQQTVGDLQPDALFISCTNFPAMGVLDELRDKFSFPVLTSNQAVLEAAIEAARDDDPTEGA